jgi:hypothetical protein
MAHNSTTTKAREKNKHTFGIHRILEFFVVCSIKFKNYQILPTKISHRYLVTTKQIVSERSSFL